MQLNKRGFQMFRANPGGPSAMATGCTVRALLLTNPSNPLGVVYPGADVCSLITWAISAGIHVIVDEVYASSVFASELAAGPAQGDTAAAAAAAAAAAPPFVSALAMVGPGKY